MKERLYHGSKKQGLVQLKPAESGHEAKFVYAVSCEAFAAIFINRTGGSLVASWGRLKDNTPYFCELKKGIFEKNYSGQAGSIYAVNREYFSQNNQLWKEEWISENVVPVIKEIKIPNIKEYLLNLEQEKKLKLISFEDRKKFFPGIDQKIVETVKKLIKKYGKEKILPGIRKYRPEILENI